MTSRKITSKTRKRSLQEVRSAIIKEKRKDKKMKKRKNNQQNEKKNLASSAHFRDITNLDLSSNLIM